MTLQNAVKNARVEGKPRRINPNANLLEVTVAYETLNGNKTPKKADFQVRLRRQYNPVKEMYLPEIDPEARKQISGDEYFSPIVSIVPFTKVNGETAELADVVRSYFLNKFVEQYQ